MLEQLKPGSTATVEIKPSHSPSALLLAPVLRQVTWLIRRFEGRPEAGLPRIAYLSDFYLGLMQPAPSGTQLTPVPFDGFDAELVRAPRATGEGVVLYFHGGAFFCCGLRSHRRMVARISAACGMPVLNVGYRQLPTATLTQSVQDCLDAYRMLLDSGYSSDQVVFAGDSAGGYLAFAVALRAVAEGLPAPAGITAIAPWVDLECQFSLGHPNGLTDPYLPIRQIRRLIPLLYGGPTSPVASLLDVDLSALPPTLIQVGSVEALLSDAELMTDRLARDRVPVTLQIWQRQVHVFQAFADLVPEGHAAIREIGAFVRGVITPAEKEAAA
ncbi:alpha/beta hydrolase [Pseudonocardia spinosispora]|uniref:alpha/beta hydrolase n=1 Tax=Pseudonocardia spinosispora TaxID=103441 RepID=UPI000685A8B3|nr:alpha/beta hydrolase [Pseudonocardia spinosispora]